jgi:hypothetical protein
MYEVIFQVRTVARMKMTVFWDAVLCSLAEIELNFKGAYAFGIVSLHA